MSSPTNNDTDSAFSANNNAERFNSDTPADPCVVTTTSKPAGARSTKTATGQGWVRNGP